MDSDNLGENEFDKLGLIRGKFSEGVRITMYGCNLAGSSTEDADFSPAQAAANALGGGAIVRALQGGGGAEFKQQNGKNVYDGTMIKSSDRNKQKSDLTIFKPQN